MHWLDCEKFLDNAVGCYAQVILVLCEKYDGAGMDVVKYLEKELMPVGV